MEGYVGIRFNAVRLSCVIPVAAKRFYPKFKSVCRLLKENDMTYANAGNISVLFKDGFIITSTGSNLESLGKDELIYVERCNFKKNTVYYHGRHKPSSETFMHSLIYSNMPKAKAIIHAHDEFATRPEILKGDITESEKEAPYGSLELARLAIKTFKKARSIIVLKNHGYVSTAGGLKTACNIILKTHKLMLKKARSL
jgi:L-fuculose-phosphate aldolase